MRAAASERSGALMLRASCSPRSAGRAKPKAGLAGGAGAGAGEGGAAGLGSVDFGATGAVATGVLGAEATADAAAFSSMRFFVKMKNTATLAARAATMMSKGARALPRGFLRPGC